MTWGNSNGTGNEQGKPAGPAWRVTMKRNINRGTVEKLFKAVLSLENMEECYLFFEDICTINELNSLAQRFDV